MNGSRYRTANALRVTEQLSRLGGAVMKLGQMISLDAGDALPAELTAIMARLRISCRRPSSTGYSRLNGARIGGNASPDCWHRGA